MRGAIKGRVGRLPDDLKRERADYGYFSHDWACRPAGAGYSAESVGLLPVVLGVGDQLFAKLGRRRATAGSALRGGSRAAAGLPGGSGPWRVPGFAGVVGPELRRGPVIDFPTDTFPLL